VPASPQPAAGRITGWCVSTPTGEYGTYDTSLASGYTIVTVTVDEIHADAVVGIIDQHGPTDIHEHACAL